jgi:hypothetical protein
MSGELLALLREGTDVTIRWNDIIVTNNVAAVPPVNETPGDYVWNRGFNVVILSRWGMPLFFCKCRGVNDTKLAHESRSMTALRKVAHLQPYIPRVAVVQSDRLRVMITQFLPGTPLNDLLNGALQRRMVAIVRQTLEGITELSRHSTKALPQFAEAGPIDILRETEEPLKYLADVGLSPDRASVLRNVVRGVPSLPRQLQHGDLWPANIVRAGRRLWFIDFEMFGTVQVPMYDVFHFLRTCTDGWTTRNDGGWVNRMTRDGPETDLVRTCAGAAAGRLGLDMTQAVAALVFYIVHFSSTTHKRNPDGVVWKAFFQEVEALAKALQHDVDIGRLFLGAPS